MTTGNEESLGVLLEDAHHVTSHSFLCPKWNSFSTYPTSPETWLPSRCLFLSDYHHHHSCPATQKRRSRSGLCLQPYPPYLITAKFCRFISHISLKSARFISTTTTVSLTGPPSFPSRTYDNYLRTGPPPSTLTTSSPRYVLCCRQ